MSMLDRFYLVYFNHNDAVFDLGWGKIKCAHVIVPDCVLAGQNSAKQALQEIVILPALRPEVGRIEHFLMFYSSKLKLLDLIMS